MKTLTSIALIPLFACTTVITSCDNSPIDYFKSPGDVVKAYIKILNEGDIENVTKYVTGDLFDKMSRGKAEYDNATLSQKQRMKDQLKEFSEYFNSVSIVSETSEGDEARVTLKSSLNSKRVYAKLKKRDGVWKIYSLE